MLKKFFYKRKRQEPKRHNASKITMDAASIAILTRHFSPLSCRAKSPSDLLDIVGYPHTLVFHTSLPPTITPLVEPTVSPPSPAEEEPVRLTVRNRTMTPQALLLLETSREDKTLVEEDKMDAQLEALKQRLIQFEQEREGWKDKLRVYIQREEQLRKIIRENQAKIQQLSSGYHHARYSMKSYLNPDPYYYTSRYLPKDNYYTADQIAYHYPYYQ